MTVDEEERLDQQEAQDENPTFSKRLPKPIHCSIPVGSVVTPTGLYPTAQGKRSATLGPEAIMNKP